jgi:hypothetical protein
MESVAFFAGEWLFSLAGARVSILSGDSVEESGGGGRAVCFGRRRVIEVRKRGVPSDITGRTQRDADLTQEPFTFDLNLKYMSARTGRPSSLAGVLYRAVRQDSTAAASSSLLPELISTVTCCMMPCTSTANANSKLPRTPVLMRISDLDYT